MEVETTKTYATLGQYLLKGTLGKGVSAKVKKGRCYISQKMYAIKIFKKNQTNFNKKAVSEEAACLNLVKHDNVPVLFDYFEAQYVKKNGQRYDVAAIVMEYLPNGDLFDYVEAYRRGFPEDVARTLFKSLIETMGDVHSQGVAHRDLKAENLMFDEDFNLNVGDFGHGVRFKNENGEKFLLKGVAGTPGYSAPEVCPGAVYNAAAVDVFSCGVILFILMAGGQPFITSSQSDLYYSKIASKSYNAFWAIWKRHGYQFSNEFKDLVQAMLALKPNERPSIEEIKEHAWMNGPVVDSEDMKNFLREIKKGKEEGIPVMMEEETGI